MPTTFTCAAQTKGPALLRCSIHHLLLVVYGNPLFSLVGFNPLEAGFLCSMGCFSYKIAVEEPFGMLGIDRKNAVSGTVEPGGNSDIFGCQRWVGILKAWRRERRP